MNIRKPQLFAAIIAVCGVLSVTASCERHPLEEDPNKQNVIEPEARTTPSEDQVAVKLTADMPTAVMSNFSNNTTGAAFVKRLGSATTSVTDNTKVALIKGSDLATVSDEIIGNIADVLLRDGLLAIETPSARDLLSFIARLIIVQSARQQQYIEDNYEFDSDVDPAADAAAELSARYGARMSTIKDIATRAGIGNMDEGMAEMIIVSNKEYFYQEPIGVNVQIGAAAIDENGNREESDYSHLVIERTPYTCGLSADDAVEWLNGIDEQRKKTRSLSRDILTRAGAESLNNLMDASESFTLSGPIYHTYWDKDLGWRQNSVMHTFRSWGVHNMKNNEDYYYIQQDVLIRMGPSTSKDGTLNRIYFPCEEGRWYNASNYGEFNRWYGSFFSRFITSMDLSGNGTITLEEARPYTNNSTGYKTVNVGSEQSTTETIGITWGANIGLDPSINVGGEYSLGYTKGTYFEVASTHVDDDITAVKNTDGTKVTWTYSGTPPLFRDVIQGDYHYFYHTVVPQALVNDINIDNQIVWSVAKPSGQYTLNVTSHPFVAAMLYEYYDGEYKGTPKHKLYETYTYEKNNFSHTLLDPFRATQTWRMRVKVDKMKDGGPAGTAASAIEARLRTKFSCFRDEFSLCDRTPTSVQVINANVLSTKEIFKNNLDILQEFAEEQGVKKYTIHWRCDDSKIQLREGFTVETLF